MMLLLFSFISVTNSAYPFDTSKGAPVCSVPKCNVCISDTVEYSPTQAYTQHRHIKGGDAFFETVLADECCGASSCHGSGNIQKGYGDCWKASGGHGECGFLDLCQDDRCHCRRLSYEIIPHECQKCEEGWELTADHQCRPCDHDHRGPDGKKCIPIDMCKERIDSCDANAVCEFTGPSQHKCKCKEGYEGDGTQCTPIDNCAKGIICDASAKCRPTGPGAHVCECKAGFEGDGSYCRDVDECTSSASSLPCKSSEFCVNQKGSFVCTACHEHCADGCKGGAADECDSCHSLSDGAFCVDKCPLDKYADDAGKCQPCDEQCRNGCGGEGATQCVECAHVKALNGTCLQSCPTDHFIALGVGSLSPHVCKECKSECKTGHYISSPCGSESDVVCDECERGYMCIAQERIVCPPGTFQPQRGQSACAPCPLQMVAGHSGSTQCMMCPRGYKHNSNHTECVPVDECADSLRLCSSNFVCVDTNEGYSCVSNSAEALNGGGKPSAAAVGGDDALMIGVIVLVVVACVLSAVLIYCCCCKKTNGADGRGKHGRVPVDKEGSIPDWLNPLSDTPVPSTPSTSIRSTAPPSPFPAQYVSEEGRQSREVMCPEGVTVELTSTSTHSMDTHV